MFDETGRFVGYRGVGRHITERRLAEDALRTMQAELARVNRVTTMGEMSASIAHEVNQPIAATVTNAQAALRWLRAQPPDLDEVRHTLGRIVRTASAPATSSTGSGPSSRRLRRGRTARSTKPSSKVA